MPGNSDAGSGTVQQELLGLFGHPVKFKVRSSEIMCCWDLILDMGGARSAQSSFGFPLSLPENDFLVYFNEWCLPAAQPATDGLRSQ